MTDTLIEVTQADREAARRAMGYYPCTNPIGAGETPSKVNALYQAFAAHRIQAIATLTAENEKLEAALRYYASEEPYLIDADDFGDRAKAALDGTSTAAP